MQHIETQIKRSLIALVTLLALACTAPANLWAETRTSDIVCEQSASERGIDAADLPDITATNAIVGKADGTVYYERDADSAAKIASITKIMTALLTLENVSDLSATVTADAEDASIGESTAELKEGDTLTVKECLRGLMIPSGNDAANVLAKYVGKILDPNTSDPLSTFIDAMNARAEELGCTDTKFTNPHGLDFGAWEDDLHSTCRDIYKVTIKAMENDTFREIAADPDNHITVTGADGTQRTYEMTTHNMLLGQNGNIGIKTGTTYEAGYCFVGAYDRNGDTIYTVVLGSTSSDERFTDTAALANWYYDHVKTVSVVNTIETCANGSPLIARVPVLAWTDKTVDATVADTEQTVTAFSLEGDLSVDYSFEKLTGTVQTGDSVGTMTISQDGEELANVELVAAEDVEAPDPLSWLMVKFDTLIRTIRGEDTSAATELVATDPSF